MIEIDARGKPCPQPVITAKKAAKAGSPFSILVDGSGQAENVQRAVNRSGAESSIERLKGYDRVKVIPSNAADKQPNTSSGLVVSVPCDSFGTGGDPVPEDVLCRAYFHTLTKLEAAREKRREDSRMRYLSQTSQTYGKTLSRFRLKHV